MTHPLGIDDRFKTGSPGVSVHVMGPTAPHRALILGHGAGGTMEAPLLVDLQQRLAARGVLCGRYNFLYTEQGRKAPDRAPKCVETVTAVAEAIRERYQPEAIYLGGKSMGGRMASMAVSEGYPAAGLVFLGYPLHPPGQEAKLRTEHLSRISCPMLFISGSQDRLARIDLLQAAVTALGPVATLLRVEGGDHSLDLPKKAGKPRPVLLEELTDFILAWMDGAAP